ncbi:unnamed protein product [Fusarium graminearum]|uniref:Chromosome 1, complete genome n=1 Tax=Gibberella zeae (strain ATCC MYA-4620 / CBS 123657 / FGSC 9075 / NRRL 31084 / PH-1) TaxID=229533 RepID=A0A0E0RS84_GIBZE|nr:hypothetical protein FG05_35177 [Fusarium graminearum]CEF74109.1 unnamed protein product [Fusarium graminearum]
MGKQRERQVVNDAWNLLSPSDDSDAAVPDAVCHVHTGTYRVFGLPVLR